LHRTRDYFPQHFVAREVLLILAMLSEESPIRLRDGSTRTGQPRYDD